MSPEILFKTKDQQAVSGSSRRDAESRQDLFRLLVDNALDVITILDEQGVVKFDNPRITDILGYSIEERKGTNAFDAIHPEDIRQVQKVFSEVLKKPKNIRSATFRYRHKDGSWRCLESIGINLLDNPLVCGVIVSSRDITLLKEHERELENAREHLEEQVRERTQTLEEFSKKLAYKNEQQAVLAKAGTILSSSLDYETTIETITQLVVPQFADWCVIDLVNDKQEYTKRFVGHHDPAMIAWVREIEQEYPPRRRPDDVIATKSPILLEEVPDELLVRTAPDERYLELVRSMGLSSAIGVPLLVGEAVLGVLTLAYSRADKHYTKEDLDFAVDLSHNIAYAIRNAELFRHAEETTQYIEHERVKDEAILNSIGEGLIVLDTKDHVTLMNPAAEGMLRCSREEVIGRHLGDIFQIQDGFGRIMPWDARPITKVSLTRDFIVSTSDNYYYVRRDGSRFPVSIVASPVVLDGTMKGKVLAFKDVTREKEIDRAKDEFISIASHQLRTPLSTINWYIESLLIDTDKGEMSHDHSKARKYLNQVFTANKRMIQLVNSLLNVSRLELGTVVVEPQPMHITSLLKTILQDLKGEIRRRYITVRELYEEDLSPITLDPQITSIVLQNLITNAIKYIPDERNNKLVSISVFEGSAPQRGRKPIRNCKDGIVVSVSDNGFGISREEQGKLFKKFFRSEHATEVDHEGSGLGLYITKKLLELVGGKIWFTSHAGKGTTFYVFFPRDIKHAVTAQGKFEEQRILA